MPTHLALLRGINVGGRNTVTMADLRAVVTGLGYSDVATYVQSGNVVFTAPEHDLGELAELIQHAMKDRLGRDPQVVVMTRAELADLVEQNPFPGEANHKHLHTVFHRQEITAEQERSIAAAEQRARDKGSHDRVVVAGRVIFLHTPDGFGRSELVAQLARRTPRDIPVGTARNWTSVTALLRLLSE